MSKPLQAWIVRVSMRKEVDAAPVPVLYLRMRTASREEALEMAMAKADAVMRAVNEVMPDATPVGLEWDVYDDAQLAEEQAEAWGNIVEVDALAQEAKGWWKVVLLVRAEPGQDSPEAWHWPTIIDGDTRLLSIEPAAAPEKEA